MDAPGRHENRTRETLSRALAATGLDAAFPACHYPCRRRRCRGPRLRRDVPQRLRGSDRRCTPQPPLRRRCAASRSPPRCPGAASRCRVGPRTRPRIGRAQIPAFGLETTRLASVRTGQDHFPSQWTESGRESCSHVVQCSSEGPGTPRVFATFAPRRSAPSKTEAPTLDEPKSKPRMSARLKFDDIAVDQTEQSGTTAGFPAGPPPASPRC